MIRKYDENRNTNIAACTEQVQDLTVQKRKKSSLLFTKPHSKAWARKAPSKAESEELTCWSHKDLKL